MPPAPTSAPVSTGEGLHRGLTQRQLTMTAVGSAIGVGPIKLVALRPAAWFGTASLCAIAVTTFFVDGLRYTVPSFLPFLALMSLWYSRTRQARRA